MVFDYQAYQGLIKKIGEEPNEADRNDLYSMLEDAMKSAIRYVDAVDCMEISLPRLMGESTGADLRFQISMLDKQRRAAHESAIASVAIVNRLTASFDLPPIYTGPADDRYQVADYCVEVLSVLFKNRTR